jgi:hypothetical protein
MRIAAVRRGSREILACPVARDPFRTLKSSHAPRKIRVDLDSATKLAKSRMA